MTTGNILCSPSPDKIEQRYREKEMAYLQAKGITLNSWCFAGPFHQHGVNPFYHVFKPEKRINLNQKLETNGTGWIAKPEWQTAQIYRFPEVDSAAYYVYRTIYAKNAVTCPLYLGSDDGIRVWLNDKLIYENNVDRPVSGASDFVELKLRKGENRLLLKIINNLKRTGFYFSVFQMDQHDQVLDTAFLETEEAVKRSVAIYKKVRPFMMGDFYPLFPHDPSEKAWYGYQFHRQDLDAGIAIIFRRKDALESKNTIKLFGLDGGSYKVFFETLKQEDVIKNSELEVLIDQLPGSEIVFYQKGSS